MRIVSLLASATEMICALGAGESLVGRSHECDHPLWVKALPQCSEIAFDISLSSGEIDREVRRRLSAGEPLYRVDIELMRGLTPTLIVAQQHCEVCAVTPGDVERSGACIPGATILPLSAGSVDEIFDSLLATAHAVDQVAAGHALIQRERARMQALRSATHSLAHPSVVLLEWTDPIFPMGNWGPELVEMAGGALALGNRNQHSSAIPAEQVRAADPEFLIIAPCGFDLARTMRELPVLEAYPWWKELRAVRTGKVAFADGNLYFNRSGMTVARTAEIVAEILHGKVSGEASYGRDWVWMRDFA